MATEKGQEFINKYKGVGVLRETWLIMYRKRHITLEELSECIELTEEETQALKDEQIDICPEPTPTNEELNNQLIETQKLCLNLQKQILLK